MRSTRILNLFLVFIASLSLVNCGTANAEAELDGNKKENLPKKEKAKKDKHDHELKVGDIAPDFNLKNIDGEMMSLASLEDAKGYIVTFTCNTCPYAVMYEDRLIALHNKMVKKGYPVVAINPNDPDVKPGDNFDGMIERAETKAFPFAYLFDEGQKVYPKYGATKTPHVFLLDANRKVRYIGSIDDSATDPEAVSQKFVESAIEALEMGKDPDPSYTKAIGCSIKKKA